MYSSQEELKDSDDETQLPSVKVRKSQRNGAQYKRFAHVLLKSFNHPSANTHDLPDKVAQFSRDVFFVPFFCLLFVVISHDDGYDFVVDDLFAISPPEEGYEGSAVKATRSLKLPPWTTLAGHSENPLEKIHRNDLFTIINTLYLYLCQLQLMQGKQKLR